MSDALVLILGSAAGTFLVGISVIFIWYCMFCSRSSLKSSETNSSGASVQVEQAVELSIRGPTYPSGYQGAWCFTLDELMAATKSFSEINLLGYGNYGEVYKGLLHDGALVAVKRRIFAASQEFVRQVQYLSLIRHRNLVSLLGYCQKSDFQMLVYEYVNNGSMSSYLYGTRQSLSEKLEFKHRLSIALGAAKGLEHLHSFNPPLLHMNFRTANVLVDQDFVPKVADAGLKRLIDKLSGAAPSFYEMDCDLFLDPQVKETGMFTMKSDVYSFGVFLLELVSGRGATSQASESNDSINEWV